ncbi:transmembrane protein 79, partial [Tachysurus ichikawai]
LLVERVERDRGEEPTVFLTDQEPDTKGTRRLPGVKTHRDTQPFALQEREMETERIQTQVEMEGYQLPVFHSVPLGEEGMNERQEVITREQKETVKDVVERTTGRESRTESERQLDRGQETWREEGDGQLADDDDDDGHRMSSVFSPLVKIVRKTDEKQTESFVLRAADVRAEDVHMHRDNTKQVPQEHDQSCE